MDPLVLVLCAVLAVAGFLVGRRSTAAEVVRLSLTLEHERTSYDERLALAARSDAQTRETFEALAAQALERSERRFLALAETRLTAASAGATAELESRRQAVEQLVRPLSEQLGGVERQLREIEGDRVSTYAALREQVRGMQATSEQLRRDTAQLVSALRAPQVRGRWGEMQLRRVVEAAGMVEHCDFSEQPRSLTSDGDVRRPDLVVRLAGGKSVVVDAKVPFAAFLEAMDAPDEATRRRRLAAHARHLRAHIDALSAKSYWSLFDPSPEFVVLFVPAEAFLSAALEQEPALYEHAFDRDVVLATPNNLIALLRTVAHTWRQESLATGAREVSALGRELHARLATMGDHVSGLGASLTGAVTSYNRAVSSLESRVLVTARKLADLEVARGELPTPEQVEVVPRRVQAPELVPPLDQAPALVPPPGGRALDEAPALVPPLDEAPAPAPPVEGQALPEAG